MFDIFDTYIHTNLCLLSGFGDKKPSLNIFDQLYFITRKFNMPSDYLSYKGALINGKWIGGEDTEMISVLDPSNGKRF